MLRATGLWFGYDQSSVLQNVDISLANGEFVAVVGPSGCGKTSLMYCLAGVLEPQQGDIFFRDVAFGRSTDDERARIRRKHFGFVFQSSELVPELTLHDNVGLPLRLNGVGKTEATRRVDEILERLGLSSVRDQRPGQVSGGQAQRAAVARAVIHKPALVFADEPTGALDRESGDRVLAEMLDLCSTESTSLLLVTHDADVANRADRVLHMIDGRWIEATR